jgi:hypothetical protein
MGVHAWLLRREIDALITAQSYQSNPAQSWTQKELAEKQTLYYKLTGTTWPPGSARPSSD